MNEVIRTGISDELQRSNDYIMSLNPEEKRQYRAQQRYLLIEDAYGTDVADVVFARREEGRREMKR